MRLCQDTFEPDFDTREYLSMVVLLNTFTVFVKLNEKSVERVSMHMCGRNSVRTGLGQRRVIWLIQYNDV